MQNNESRTLCKGVFFEESRGATLNLKSKKSGIERAGLPNTHQAFSKKPGERLVKQAPGLHVLKQRGLPGFSPKLVNTIIALFFLGAVTATLFLPWSIGKVYAASDPWPIINEIRAEIPPFPGIDTVDPDKSGSGKVGTGREPFRQSRKGRDGQKTPRPRTIPHRGHTWGG